MTDLVIIKAGDFGKEIAEVVCNLTRENAAAWNLLGFIDEEVTGSVNGVKVLGKLDDYLKMDKNIQFFVADMDGRERQRIAQLCKAAGFTGATILDRVGDIAAGCEIGQGCYIGYECYLSPAVKLGEFCIVERESVIGHDTVVGDYSTFRIHASLGGDSIICAHNYLGVRSVMINLINTPDHCHFAAGSCVIKNTGVPGYYEGVPAKLVRAFED
jgi:sugar O-acyltransferase (sialic acid O-acetyltransferase NeuD family)